MVVLMYIMAQNLKLKSLARQRLPTLQKRLSFLTETNEMANYQLNINGSQVAVEDVADDTPLLWVLRDTLNLVGTKFGCGGGFCGACTVHIDGNAVRSCQLTISMLKDKSITTIEGLADGAQLHPLQQAWIDQDVPQCGYCQAGQIMSAAALLDRNVQPTAEEIESAMVGNLCRCGCYVRIKSAIASVANQIPVGIYEPKLSAEEGLS